MTWDIKWNIYDIPPLYRMVRRFKASINSYAVIILIHDYNFMCYIYI